MPNEAFARVKIDTQLKAVGWNLEDGQSVHFEYLLPDGTKADYVLCDRNGRPLAVLEAKRFSENKPLEIACKQAQAYADQLKVDFIFLANGVEVKFWDHKQEAYPHEVKTVFDQENLERRVASRKLRRDIMTVPIDRKIVGGDGRTYQFHAINAVCEGITHNRRKFLLEMATGTGKTRIGAALIKRLMEASHATRVLFLVDRIALAKQTDEAFQDLLRGYSSYVFKQGNFQHQNQICVTTLQSMINEYHKISSGYFDLIIIDECHRSIYGEWRVVLDHFDGIKVGLTATPCIADPEHIPDDDERQFVRDTLRFFEVAAPPFGQIEHLGQQCDNTVGLIRGFLQLMVQVRDILGTNLQYFPRTILRQYEALDKQLVILIAFLLHLGMAFHVHLAKLLHSVGGTRALFLLDRIAAIIHLRAQRIGFLPCLIQGECPELPDGVAAASALLRAVVVDKVFLTVGAYTNTETRQLAVPMDFVAVGRQR